MTPICGRQPNLRRGPGKPPPGSRSHNACELVAVALVFFAIAFLTTRGILAASTGV
jgi:hypothetical protein